MNAVTYHYTLYRGNKEQFSTDSKGEMRKRLDTTKNRRAYTVVTETRIDGRTRCRDNAEAGRWWVVSGI
jgi:hypothetical protein